jgi:hypothetical protein
LPRPYAPIHGARSDQALGYKRAAENEPAWHLEQHATIEGQTPDPSSATFKPKSLANRSPSSSSRVPRPISNVTGHPE